MRSAYCETSAGALKTFIEAGTPCQLVDLYTLTLLSTTVYRWTSCGSNVTTPDARTFLATGPALNRGRAVQSAGLVVSTLDVTMGAAGSFTLGGVPLARAAADGVLEQATLQLESGWIDPATGVVVGTLVEFIGQTYDVKPESSRVVVTFASPLQTLSTTQIPVRSYVPACSRMLFDAGCGVTKATYQVSGTVSGSPTTTSLPTNLTQADGFFNGGVVTFLTGANAGLTISVSTFTHTGGVVVPATALPNTPTAGDTFNIWRGCNKTLGVGGCADFSNQARFGGFPFLPNEDTTTI